MTLVARVSRAPALVNVAIRADEMLTDSAGSNPRLIRAAAPSCVTGCPNESKALISIETRRRVPDGRGILEPAPIANLIQATLDPPGRPTTTADEPSWVATTVAAPTGTETTVGGVDPDAEAIRTSATVAAIPRPDWTSTSLTNASIRRSARAVSPFAMALRAASTFALRLFVMPGEIAPAAAATSISS